MRAQTVSTWLLALLPLATASVAAGGNDQLKPDELTPQRVVGPGEYVEPEPEAAPGLSLHLDFAASAGRKGWQCADLPGGESSLWVRPEEGWRSLVREAKPCDAVRPASGPKPPAFSEIDLKPYRKVKGWSDWLCADFKDGRAWSAWHMKKDPASTARAYAGTCDSWIKR